MAGGDTRRIAGVGWFHAGCVAELQRHLPVGLCGNRADHVPHRIEFVAVANGPMWCHADQSKRVPFSIRQPQFENSGCHQFPNLST